MESKITLSHGDGGKHTNRIIKEIFYKYFDNKILRQGLDASIINEIKGKIAFTTDSFVVKPLFFPGGDIGKLAVYGTVNDLAVSGAKPLFLSCGFIIEEGFQISSLESIVKSMAEACNEVGIKIITGDTKVVEKGNGDGIFINTSGIGVIENDYRQKVIEEGDNIIITGTIADHGTTILVKRYDLDFKGKLKSDCGSVYKIVKELENEMDYIKIMKDPTRGGIGTALNEIKEHFNGSIEIIEDQIPISKEVWAVNEILGIDPLYLPCEGRVLLVVKKEKAEEILNKIRKIEGCEKANIIGIFRTDVNNIVYLRTAIGGKRIIGMLENPMLPRIC